MWAQIWAQVQRETQSVCQKTNYRPLYLKYPRLFTPLNIIDHEEMIWCGVFCILLERLCSFVQLNFRWCLTPSSTLHFTSRLLCCDSDVLKTLPHLRNKQRHESVHVDRRNGSCVCGEDVGEVQRAGRLLDHLQVRHIQRFSSLYLSFYLTLSWCVGGGMMVLKHSSLLE